MGSAVASLLKDWPTQITRLEAEVLQHEVSISGVKESVRHVLNSRVAKDGHLTAEQMYDAIKEHETYISHQRLAVGGSRQTPQTHSQPTRGAPAPQTYKPKFHKTTAFSAKAGGGHDPPATMAEEGNTSDGASPDDGGGLYIPDFLCDAEDWELSVKLARAMQADERSRRHCFGCDSPITWSVTAPMQKTTRGPHSRGGALPKRFRHRHR